MTKLQEAFDAVQAEDGLKVCTADAVVQALRKEAKPRRRGRRISVLALAFCLLLVAGIGGHHLYFTPTTVLSIDINPSLEMDINRFDRVIALNGYNNDGAALAEALDVNNMHYNEAIDTLMANDTIEECLARGEELSIAVVQADADERAQSDAVLDYVSNCTAHHANAHCYTIQSSDAQMDDAHNAGLSCGKYHMYETLLAYDATLTPEEVQQMTMRELRALLAQYEGDDGAAAANSVAENNGYSPHNGMKNGARHGGHHSDGHE